MRVENRNKCFNFPGDINGLRERTLQLVHRFGLYFFMGGHPTSLNFEQGLLSPSNALEANDRIKGISMPLLCSAFGKETQQAFHKNLKNVPDCRSGRFHV